MLKALDVVGLSQLTCHCNILLTLGKVPLQQVVERKGPADCQATDGHLSQANLSHLFVVGARALLTFLILMDSTPNFYGQNFQVQPSVGHSQVGDYIYAFCR